MIKVFGIEHIIYLIISFAITALIIILGKKFCVTEKSKAVLIKTLAAIYVVVIVLNRIFCAYYWGPSYGGSEPFLPRSFCGTVSLFFSVSLLFTKKDSKIYHCLVYLALFAGFVPTLYANYIGQGTSFGVESIFFPPTITSLIHHSMMFMMALLLIFLGEFKPNIKNWICFPAGYALLTLYGVCYNSFLNKSGGFAIGSPVIGNFDNARIFVVSTLVYTVFIIIYDLIENKDESLFPRIWRKIFKKEEKK